MAADTALVASDSVTAFRSGSLSQMRYTDGSRQPASVLVAGLERRRRARASPDARRSDRETAARSAPGSGSMRHLPFDSERAEKLRDLGPAHLGRMPLAVKQDEATDPSDIGLLGAPTAVAQPIGLAHAIQQSRLAHASIDLERHSW